MDSSTLPIEVRSIDENDHRVVPTRNNPRGDLVVSEKALSKFYNTLSNKKEFLRQL